MATTRIKDVSKTTTDLASDEYIIADGATNGTQKMARNDAYADWAAAYVAAPTTYKLAPLNSGTNKIDATYLPTGADTAKGAWDANANSPALADGAGTAGDYYDVTTAGSSDLGSGSITFTVGDVVKYDGANWYKIDSVANILDGSATAASGRTALDVLSNDELARDFGTKLVGPAINFDGSNDYIEIADDDKLSFTDGTDDLPFSVCGWIKMDDATNFSVLSKYGASNPVREWIFYSTSSDLLTLFVQDTSGNITTLAVDVAVTAFEGQWIHVAATYGGSGPNSGAAFTANMSGGNAVIYINGKAQTATATDNASYAGMSNTTQPARVARYSSAYADGQIKDVKLFNRKLSSTEVTTLYNEGQLGLEDQWGGAIATSGTLTVGKRYRLRDWITADDFTNVGAASNADGVEFIATGTTPTTWSNSSEVESIGTLADIRAENFDSTTGKVYDISDNAFVGTNSGCSLVGRAYPFYETGTWTPTLTFGGGSTGMTYTSQEGFYTRIGNTVFATGGLILSAVGSSTGAAAIALPYTARNTTDDIQGVSVGRALNMASLTSAVSGYVVDNTTSCRLVDWGPTGSIDLDEGSFTNTSEINISVTYQIS